MRPTSWFRFASGATAVALAAMAGASAAAAKPVPGVHRINLFASSGLLFQTNRIACGLQNDGQTCVAFAGSPVGGGGFWPKGTPDQYIFNSGLQIAAVVDTSAGFAWAGDTSGAYFMDARGDQLTGEGITGWYNALDPADKAAWPNGAVVRDASDSIYNPLLVGQQTISQGDAWVRYWEGNPDKGPRTGPGQHPLGILVDQRALAWNFPSGNEDIVYFVFTFYNVTARSSSGVYNNPTIPAEIQSEVGAIGDQFQDLNEQKFKATLPNGIPDGGYTLNGIYVDFTMDADVAVFSQNYATAYLPFNIGATYTGTFLPEVGWQFPADVFGPPFAAAPGFIGVKYLKSPERANGEQVGLTMFSMTTNGAPHRDPVGVTQLYRYMSGFLGPTDDPCSPFTDPAVARTRRLCFLAQVQSDARMFEASGPFSLAPGHASSIVVAYIQAAPVNTPDLTIGGDVKPGIPFTGDSIAADTTKVRVIDRIAGWVTQNDRDTNGVITQDEVTTTPRSLLNKGLVAQSVFDNGFLLPNAPVAPDFYLVPGNNQVTVVWQKSETETAGDPFFVAAQDPASALYDPNFRQFDVEGYRVYRGRTSSDLTLLAQFDYSGTSFVDYTGAIDYGDTNGDGKVECAPELGLTADCPVAFDTIPPQTVGYETDLSGDVVQIPPGKRVELATGGTINLEADTAVTGGASGFPALQNTGVPFAYVDTDVRNSFTYFYTVTAFDVNSVKSGPTSLESPRVTKSVTPRKSAPNEVDAELVAGIQGDDGVLLDPSASFTIDANTGRFSGTPAPTDGISGVFAPLVQQLLPAVSLSATVDSLVPHDEADFDCGGALNGLGACYEMFVTVDKDGATQSFSQLVGWPVWSSFGVFGSSTTGQLAAVAIPADQTSADRFGIPNGFAQFNATVSATFRQYIDFSQFEGQAARRNLIGNGAGVSPGGSRWFDGTNETLDNPTIGIRVGHVAGADTIWAPIHHTDTDPATPGVQSYANSSAMQCFGYLLAGLGRQADVAFTWGSGGTISSVRDLSHHVDVQFKPVPEATYGFIGDANGDGVIDWDDFNYLETASQGAEDLGFCNHTDPGAGSRAQLAQQPIIMGVSTSQNQTNSTATGTGFGLYIDGARYIFELTGGQPPADGTVWTLRSYSGYVSAANDADGLTPTGYRFSPKTRSPGIPGLQVTFNVAAATQVAAESDSTLDHVHTVPDPYYVTDALENTSDSKVLKFVNLPPRALIRIYSVSGVLVNLIVHDDPGLGGEETWNLRNRNNQFVASGVYFYQIETPAGHTKVGRFTVVQFAP